MIQEQGSMFSTKHIDKAIHGIEEKRQVTQEKGVTRGKYGLLDGIYISGDVFTEVTILKLYLREGERSSSGERLDTYRERKDECHDDEGGGKSNLADGLSINFCSICSKVERRKGKRESGRREYKGKLETGIEGPNRGDSPIWAPRPQAYNT